MVADNAAGSTVNFRVTDDELVAAALALGKTWPHVLPTVELDEQALLEANARGLRSLMVRQLVSNVDGGIHIDPILASLIAKAAAAPASVMAYVADLSDPQVLAGTSSFLYLVDVDLSNDILDLVSPNGVHDLVEFARAQAIEVFLSVVHNAFLYGVTPRGIAHERPALLVSSTLVDGWICVTKGNVGFGDVKSIDSGSEFLAQSSSDTWDLQQITTALGIKTFL